MTSRVLSLLAVLAVLFLIGCEGDEATGPTAPTDAQGYIDLGWSQYLANALEDAYDSYQSAISMAEAEFMAAQEDSILAPNQGARDIAVAQMNAARLLTTKAVSGIGWLDIKFWNSIEGPLAFSVGLEYVEALQSMNYPDSLEVRMVQAELLGGYAFMLHLMWEWQQSNERIAELLALDDEWHLEHDPEIDYLDLRLLRAENFYYMADFDASLEEALIVNDLLNQPELTAEDFNLATIQGQSALIELIAALDDLI